LLAFGVDLQDFGLDFVTLLEQVARMTDALGPADVRDVDQAVDAVLDADEDAEIGDVANLAADYVADLVFFFDDVPRIWLDLLHAEADAAVLQVESKDDDFDLVTHLHDLRRMAYALRPGHLAD